MFPVIPSEAGHRKIEKAQKLLLDWKNLSRNKYAPPTSFAHIYKGLGKIDVASDWLEKGFDTLDGQMQLINVEFVDDAPHFHPGYKVPLRKMNLEP